MTDASGTPPPKRPNFKDELAIDSIEEGSGPEVLRRAILIHNQTVAAISNFHGLFVDSQKAGSEVRDTR